MQEARALQESASIGPSETHEFRLRPGGYEVRWECQKCDFRDEVRRLEVEAGVRYGGLIGLKDRKRDNAQ